MSDIEKEDQKTYVLLENDDFQFVEIPEMITQKISKTRITNAVHEHISWDLINHHNYGWVGDVKGYFNKYFKGKYCSRVTMDLNNIVKKYINKYGLSKGHVNDIKFCLSADNHTKPGDYNLRDEYINFKNGMLNLDTWKMENHSIRFNSTIQIPHNYNPEAKCPIFEKWLNWFCAASDDPKQMKETLLESMGYTLQLSVKLHKAFILNGPKRTGKSTFLNILASLISKNDWSMVALQTISKNEFGNWYIRNKLYNYFPDLVRKSPIKNIGTIKALTGDPYLNYTEKGGDNYDVKNILKLWFSCNGFPLVEAGDDAFFDRWVIIYCRNQLKLDEKINGFEDQIIKNEDELEGIITMVISNLRELFARGKFNNMSASEVEMEWLMETDPIYKFILEECKTGINPTNNQLYYIPQSDLYSKFITFKNNMEGLLIDDTNIISQIVFTKRLKYLGFKVVRKNNLPNRPRCYSGIHSIYQEQIPRNIGGYT